ncbi:MAG TPA: hypothetical protein VIJ81_00830 [Sphingomicrobium sp.]|jgi:hypothetical protein|nr:hypothetical protein [Sphingomicrobium sp.]
MRRILLLALVLAAPLWFMVAQDGSAAALSQRTVDLLDSRPARSILIVGNSRTYYNDMPAMIREIADSAGSPAKFQIETSARPGYYFKHHWAFGRTRHLLAAGWDDIILQGASAEQWNDEIQGDFFTYGAKLAAIARVNNGRPRLVVNWAYDPAEYQGDAEGYRELHLERIKAAHARLASEANLARINLAGLWESVRHSHPSIRLTSDGNHPTMAGSYLYALAIYANLANDRVANVAYVPDGLNPDDAKALREAVDAYPLLG